MPNTAQTPPSLHFVYLLISAVHPFQRRSPDLHRTAIRPDRDRLHGRAHAPAIRADRQVLEGWRDEAQV